jgi:DNA-directed RNA polymerase
VDFFLEWFVEHRDEYPNNPFEGDAFNSCRFIAGIIYDSVSEVCSSAEECMRYLQSMSDVFVENEARMIWTTPTGFPVIHAYKESKSSTIKTMLNERVRKVSFRERSSGYSKVASKNAISANYVHSLDAACLHLIVNKLKERGVMNVRTIHDSFGVTPCEVDILDQTIREVFVEVFSDDLLLKFHREAQALLPRVELPELPERGDPSMVPELLKSDYFFA